jgi:pimeloyl-ACP methyl ester carboxylesterase
MSSTSRQLDTHYAHSGRVSIAYQMTGEGAPLVWVPGFVSHVEMNWEIPPYSHGLERYTATPAMAAAIMRHNLQLDVRHVLSSVHAPALVIHAAGDPAVPVAQGRCVAEHLANCKRYLEGFGRLGMAAQSAIHRMRRCPRNGWVTMSSPRCAA